jgi:hypothetical protein
MTYIATLYVLIINFLNTLVKSNKIALISTLVIMVFLFGGMSKCADDIMYQNMFNYMKAHGLTIYATTEFGFTFFVFLCTKIGMSYKIFRTLIAITGLLLIQKTAIEYSKKYSLVFILYFIYPFMLDTIQIRNFLAASIVIYSFSFLAENTKKGDRKYFIGILIAFSIHYMAIFFLPFLFIKKNSVNYLATIALHLVPILCILTSTPVIPNFVRSIVGDQLAASIAMYFQRAHWGFLLLWARQLAFTVLAYYSYLYVKTRDVDERWKDLNTVIIKLNIYMIIICFPLIMFNGNFFRLLRPMLFLDYIIISQVLYLNAKRGLGYSGIAVFLLLSFFAMDILTSDNIMSVLIPFFKFNTYL